MKKNVTVQVPATSANLGPGFDVLGAALHWFNEITLEGEGFSSSGKTRELAVNIDGEGDTQLPRNESNLVVRAAYRVFETARRWPHSLKVRMVNRIPLSRGLGSSAAATLGGMVAANALIGKPLKDAEVLDSAVGMEGHPDNIVPAFAGGLCVSGLINSKTWFFQLPVSSGLKAVICVPEKPLPTSEARRVLPSRIPFNAAVFTASRVAFLIGAFAQKKYDWLGFAMDDVLHQPARAKLLPGLLEAIAAARKAGAYGASLSGAGSCVIAIAKAGMGRRIGPAMQSAFHARGLRSRWEEVSFENKGIRIR